MCWAFHSSSDLGMGFQANVNTPTFACFWVGSGALQTAPHIGRQTGGKMQVPHWATTPICSWASADSGHGISGRDSHLLTPEHGLPGSLTTDTALTLGMGANQASLTFLLWACFQANGHIGTYFSLHPCFLSMNRTNTLGTLHLLFPEHGEFPESRNIHWSLPPHRLEREFQTASQGMSFQANIHIEPLRNELRQK
ncbi:hypothetical protein CEXT_622651 [Caerostris extrusa]|uniref:Uncharacterized protein n=1 Tax=Caerostris extrusa TaxID=172846 RepID=A0AAV4N2V5_CAEEX|nr:hypothetical protein CEXT_622651 [Caerostris extrusa]